MRIPLTPKQFPVLVVRRLESGRLVLRFPPDLGWSDEFFDDRAVLADRLCDLTERGPLGQDVAVDDPGAGAESRTEYRRALCGVKAGPIGSRQL
jgi:hypothetical protein